jgi:DNA-binding transcriptional regulator LsrR (DeoR family)
MRLRKVLCASHQVRVKFISLRIRFAVGYLSNRTRQALFRAQESLMPPRRERDLILQIARMRFEERRSQRDIAKRLNTSEATVSRALKDAFDLELVEVRVRTPTDRKADLERALVDRFGLLQAVVVDTCNDPRHTLDALGRAVGEAMSLDIADNMIIGVGDGESAASVAAAFPRLWLTDVEVVPLIGGVGQLDIPSHPIEVARTIAARLNCRVRQLPAPAVVPDASTAAQIIKAPAVADAFEAMKRCAIAVVGISPIDSDTSMVRHGALTKNELEMIAATGAAGMICARAYDKKGAHIRSDLDARTLAISFDAFRSIPKRWVVGSGQAKAPALRAAFEGGIVTACGTDSAVALHLLGR